MNKGSICFFNEEIKFALPKKRKTRNWIEEILRCEGKDLGELNFIFCPDQYLHKINIDYLNHDTFTDIITFDLSEIAGMISGDIFISIERVKENAKTYHSKFNFELYRVISHGVLHLIGYNDKAPEEALEMRNKEDYYLSLLPDFIYK